MKLGKFDLENSAVPAWRNYHSVKVVAALPRSVWLGGLFIIFATLVAYWPAFSAGFIWDDDFFVTQNLALRDLSGLRQIWFNIHATLQYYPIVHTVFWVEYHLWGLQPLGFHAVNVLLHIAAALLLWRILARLELPWAWLAAAIFALHPVQVESVAWVTELKNVLSSVFYFAAALCYLRFARLDKAIGNDRWRGHFYFGALILFVAALLSKTVTCSLPAALMLILWWKKERLHRRDVYPLAPFFLVGIGLGLASAWFEQHEVGAQGAEWSLTFAERSLIAGRAVWFYAAKLFWPAQLTFIYPRWEIDARLWWQWMFPLAAVIVVAALWLARRRIGKGFLTAVLFFGGTVLPALGFANVYPMRFSFVADHFQYLAGIGIIVVGTGLAVKFFETCQADRRLQTSLAALLLLVLGVLTWQQCHIYKDLETLWTDTLKKNPRCWMAHSNLGRLLVQQGKLDEAEAHYQAALAVHPAEETIHYNYANQLVKTGRLEDGVAQYRQALQLAPEKPETHCNLGFALNQQHRTDEAIAEYERAIYYKPDFAEAYYNLGNALSSGKKMEAAIAAYQRAVRLKPDSELFKKRLQALGAPAG